MDQQYLRDFEARCSQEEAPACQSMCPLHVDARAFCAHMAAGALGEARKILDRSMPLAGLMARLCEGACLAHCRRAALDGAVNMPLLERACVNLTRSIRPMTLPATGKKIAVAGAGLSGLVLAFELAKKGHAISVFHKTAPGGRLKFIKSDTLPETALAEALEQLTALRVTFEPVPDFGPDWLKAALGKYLALYISLDDPALSLEVFGLGGISDYLTLETTLPRVFAGGQLGGGASFTPSGPAPLPSFVREAADGKRAAGSVVRLLQGVAPASARDREDVYASLLFTDLSNVKSLPPVTPACPATPTAEEARQEAERCINCQCLECVKRCPYLAEYKGYPKRYAREIYNNLAVVHGQRRANRQINSCAECGLCASVCPNKADMGAFCAEARREMIQTKRMPPSAHEFALEDMIFSNAADLAFFRHQPGTNSSAWAFFPGCQLPASMPEQTERLYAHLCSCLVDKGGVGFFLHCCGAPARWSGREALTASVAGLIREQWQAAGKPGLILACASCAAFFATELNDIPAVSLWDLLADLPLPATAVAAGPLALHDPCAARDRASTRASVRHITEALGQDTAELPLGRDLARCCGYGGLADAANPALGRVMAETCAHDSPLPLLCWCIMCRDRIRATGKESLHLLDLLFPLQDADSAAMRPAPGISLRQEQRLAFRNGLLQKLWNEQPPEASAMDNITLRINDEVARKLEARRILHTDIKAVLLHASKEGPQFAHKGTGRYLSSLRPKQVTFWVEYSREPDKAFVIHDAYCHRMVVPGTPGEGLPTAAILEGHADKGGRM